MRHIKYDIMLHIKYDIIRIWYNAAYQTLLTFYNLIPCGVSISAMLAYCLYKMFFLQILVISWIWSSIWSMLSPRISPPPSVGIFLVFSLVVISKYLANADWAWKRGWSKHYSTTEFVDNRGHQPNTRRSLSHWPRL